MTEKKKRAQREATRRYRAANAEKVRERGRDAARLRRAKDPEKDREYQRKYRLKNLDALRARSRTYKRLKVYGLTEKAYDELLLAQEFACAVCRQPSPGSKNDWHIDHCHITGRVRGVLCHHCNQLLANAKDNIKTLNSAIRYLRRTQ